MSSTYYPKLLILTISILTSLFFFACSPKKTKTETYSVPQTEILPEQIDQEPQSNDNSLPKQSDQNSEAVKLTSKLTSCFRSASALEKQEKYGEASEKHSECCFLGNLDSCNQAGGLKLEIFNHIKAAYNFFKMACDGKNPEGCFNLYELEKELGHDAIADTYHELACSHGLQSACVNQIELGKTYLKGHQFQKAIQSFNKILSQQPKNEIALALRAYAYNQTGQYFKAYQDYSAAIAINANNPHYYTERALYHISKQNFQLATEEYNHAIGIEAKAEFYRMRGLMQLYLGDFPRSIQDNSDAIRINPEDLVAYVNRGSAWMHLRNYQKAIENYNHVILLKSDHDLALSNRGMAYQMMGELEKARIDFKKAVDISDNNTLMILNYLEVKILSNDFSNIDDYVKRAYLTARNNEEKLLTLFTDLLLKVLQKKSIEASEKEFNHHLKKKVLLQTSFDALEEYLKKMRPSNAELEKVINYIEQLKNPKLNLFYR